jgi:hypothetical protein
MLEGIFVVNYFGRIYARGGACAEGICVTGTFSVFRSQLFSLTPASFVYSTDFCPPAEAGPLDAAPWTTAGGPYGLGLVDAAHRRRARSMGVGPARMALRR